MPRRAFTLVEMLIVLLIIITLMGLLIPAISLVKRKGKEAQAREQLAKIEAALASFRNVNGVYPEDGMTVDAAANNKRLLIALNTVNRDFRLVDATGAATTVEANMKPLVDPWGNPIRYRPARLYAWGTSTDAADIDGANPPNADTYQLWSVGPNGTDNRGRADDLVTWKKTP